MNKGIKLFLTMLLCAALIMSLAACSSPSTATAKTPSTLDQIKSKGELVVGTSADYKPYEFHDTSSGTDVITGWEMEMAQDLAKELGVKLVIKDQAFDGLLTALNAKQVDIVIAAMTITEKRAQAVDFSMPYHDGGQMIMTLKDRSDIKSAADLKGKKVGVQLGSTGEEQAKKIEGADVKATQNFESAVLDLMSKKVDAVIGGVTVVQNYAKINDKLQAAGQPLSDEKNGIAMRKGDTDLKRAIDQALDKMIKDGRLNNMKQKWLGKDGI